MRVKETRASGLAKRSRKSFTTNIKAAADFHKYVTIPQKDCSEYGEGPFQQKQMPTCYL